MPRKTYYLTQINVLRTYIRLLFFPVNQNLDYDYPLSDHFWETRTIFSFAFLLLIVLIAWKCYEKHLILSFGILWFFITISVVTLVPFRDVLFEHRLYLSMVGFCLVLPVTMFGLLKNRKKVGIVFLVIISVLSILTYRRNLVWKSPLSLWSDAVKKSPQKSRPHDNLASIYLDQGDYQRSLKYLRKARELDPNNSETYNNFALIYMYTGRADLAMKNLRLALTISPYNSTTHNNLGLLFLERNDFNSAEKEFLNAVKYNPRILEPKLNLATVYRRKEEFDKAIALYEELKEQHADDKNSLYALIELYQMQDRKTEVIEIGNSILRDMKDTQKLTRFGSLLADQGYVNLAAGIFAKALRNDPKYKESYLELGKLLANLEQFDKAIDIWKNGLKIDPSDQRFLNHIHTARELQAQAQSLNDSR